MLTDQLTDAPTSTPVTGPLAIAAIAQLDALAAAPDAKFAQRSQTFFKIICICHHLESVSPDDGNKGPLLITRTVEHLCDTSCYA